MKPFTYTVTVEVAHVEGKFVSRDDVAAELADAIEQADPGNISVDESEYEVVEWGVAYA